MTRAPREPDLSVVVPCYQEIDAIPPLLDALTAWRAGRGDVEILFVDDGSTDGTGEALRGAGARLRGARVLRHATNRGVGAAMRTGFEAARGRVVVCYDADRTYPLADVDRLVATLDEGFDVASASPFLAGAGLDGVPLWRRLLTRGAALAYRIALRRPTEVRTFSCAFRAYRGEVARRVRFRSDGFPAAAEILGGLIRDGARVKEVPSVLSERREGRSKMRVLRAALGHLGVLARLLRRPPPGRVTTTDADPAVVEPR